jgi:hypothetical protein
MRSANLSMLRLALVSLLLGGLTGIPLAAQTKSKDKDPKSTPAFKLPSGAIIVVTSDPDLIDKSASIYLTPERYKELNDQIESLKKQVANEKPAAVPSHCELSGRIEKRGGTNIVRVRATFRYRTTQPRTVVFLGCQKMQLMEAKTEDDKLPMLATGDKGLSVLVEEPGEQTLRLELESALLPRAAKSSQVGFELGLPGAAITLLSFATPPKVQRVNVSRREMITAPLFNTPIAEGPLDVKRVDAERLQAGHGGEPLGAITYLSVTWDDESAASAAAVRSAEADIQVTIGDMEIATEARLRLKGAAKEWRFAAPSNAEVSIGRVPVAAGGKPVDYPIDQAPELIRPEPGQSIWRIHFREVNASELLAVVVVRTPRSRAEPKGKSFWPVYPFAVHDVTQQSGTIRVKFPPYIKVVPMVKGDTQRLDGSQDLAGDALFRYRTLPIGSKGQPTTPLELDIRPAVGVVQTRVHHQLRMAEGGWRLHSEIAVSPIRMDVEALELEVPTAVVFEAVTPRLVESVSAVRDAGAQRRVVQMKLATAQRGEFTVAIEGFYPIPVGAQQMTISLPRVVNAFDRQGQVTVAVPEGFDLRCNAFEWESDRLGKQPFALEPASGMDKANLLTTTASRPISHIDLAWKAQRADIRVESQVDISIGDRQAQATQTLKFFFADRIPKKLRIRASSAVSGLAVNSGSLELNGPLDWFVIPAAELGKETTLVLNYAFPLPSHANDSQAVLLVPLLWEDGTNWCENRIRVWRERSSTRAWKLAAEGNVWEERPPDLIAGESSLPLLVLQASGSNVPLALRITDAQSASGAGYPSALTSIWIDRTLIQAQSTGAIQQYRVRFHLARWTVRTLDIELPDGASDAEASLNGIRIDLRIGRTESDSGRTLQIILPAWQDRAQSLVEIRYQLPAGRRDGLGRLLAIWHPPRLTDRVALSTVRWQIAIPSNSVPLSLGDGVFEERWAIRNGIAQPLAAHTTADLERWISSGREPDGSETASGWEMSDGGITARHDNLMPLRTAVVPRPVFLAAVSLLVLAIGLLLARLPRRAVGVLLALATAGAVVVGFLWPQPSGQVLSAAQPGLMLLAVILGTQRFLQWRYRRRLTRMPGFARVQTEPASARSNGKRILRETSTIDAPAAS